MDLDGNVWVNNRGNNSVTKIGLKEAGNCVDRNGDGVITTSTGGADVKGWTGAWGGGVAGATDECILLHLSPTYAGVESPHDLRLLAVDAGNNIFVGGITGRGLFKLRATDGAVLAATNTHGSHYGGFVDPGGTLWVSSANGGWVQTVSNDLQSIRLIPIGVLGYGIAMDKNGRVWSSEWSGGQIQRMDADGTNQRIFNQSVDQGQGLAVAPNGDVFVAGSMNHAVVDHFDNNGALIESLKNAGRGDRGGAGRRGQAVDLELHDQQRVADRPDDRAGGRLRDRQRAVQLQRHDGLRVPQHDQRAWDLERRLDGGTGVDYWRSVAWGVRSLPTGTSSTCGRGPRRTWWGWAQRRGSA